MSLTLFKFSMDDGDEVLMLNLYSVGLFAKSILLSDLKTCSADGFGVSLLIFFCNRALISIGNTAAAPCGSGEFIVGKRCSG